MTPPDDPGQFPRTRWTLIARLKSPDSGTARRALDDLCTQYYYPLYSFIRRLGFEHHDAQDALHDFLARLVRLGTFENADATRGRLRAFLAAALRRYCINWRRDRAHQAREVSFDLPSDDAEARYREERFAADEAPERIFDRKWGHELLRRVLCRLGESYAARGRGALFKALQPVLLAGGSMRGQDTARLAAAAGMTEGALRVALSRLLADYRSILEDEVSNTVESPDQVKAEIAHLHSVFREG